MVHHTVRRLYGDNCFFADNSWKRSQRRNTGDTLIFNFGNTCCGGGGYSYGECCGGGSFWEGLGAGIGMGIANLFGGLMGGFIGMPCMFGGGMWGGMPWTSYWGGGGAYTPSTKTAKDDAGAADDDVKPLGAGKDVKPTDNNDKDFAKINDIRNKLRVERGKNSPNLDQIKALYNEIKPFTEDNASFLDTLNNDQDKIGYKQLLDEFKLYCVVDDSGNITALKQLNPNTDQAAINNLYLGLTLPSGVSATDLFNKGIRPTLLQYNNNSDDIWGLTLPNDPSDAEAIKLLAKCTNINVAFEYNLQAGDHWIIGTVGDVKTKQNGTLESYTIDCATFKGSKLQDKYKLYLKDNQSWNGDVTINRIRRSGNDTNESEEKTVRYTNGMYKHTDSDCYKK